MRNSIRKTLGAAALVAGLTVAAVPAARADLLQVFNSGGQFSDWLAISKRAGFTPQMQGSAKHTVFAAVNSAFSSGKAQQLLHSDDRQMLRQSILLQVVDGVHPVSSFMGKTTTLTTVGGAQVTVKDTGDKMQVISNGPDGHVVADVVMQPIATSNGIIYPVDKFF